MFNHSKTSISSANTKRSFHDPDLFDLSVHVRIWAIDMYHTTANKEQKRYDPTELTMRYIYDDLVMYNEKPEYYDSVTTKLPKSQSLFATTFRNNTDAEQEYCFRTERSTRSVAEIEIEKGVTFCKEMALKLALPGDMLEASAGFKKEIALSNIGRQATEEEVTWGVDTRITVPPRQNATAEIKISEEELNCNFRLLSTIYGRIRVVFQDPTNDNTFLKYIEGDFGTIIQKALTNSNLKSDLSTGKYHVWTEPHKGGRRIVYLETYGRCRFRFGVHQNVEVHQTD